jgi:hypothetical protein
MVIIGPYLTIGVWDRDTSTQWSPHRQEPVAPFKNATSREFRIPPPAGAGGFQFAGIEASPAGGTNPINHDQRTGDLIAMEWKKPPRERLFARQSIAVYPLKYTCLSSTVKPKIIA